MNITRWEPFREMEQMFRQFSPLLSRSTWREGGELAQWSPAADITETDKEYLIKAELPDIRKEDVRITLQEGVINITGERKREKEHKDENEIRVERMYGQFSRSFALPDNIDEQGIRAESKDGVLRIHVPKTAPTHAKPIQIEVK